MESHTYYVVHDPQDSACDHDVLSLAPITTNVLSFNRIFTTNNTLLYIELHLEAGVLGVDDLGEDELPEVRPLLEDGLLRQGRTEGRHVAPRSHRHLVPNRMARNTIGRATQLTTVSFS